MEITWHDNTCFTVKGKTKSLVINPHRKAGKLKGEMVLNSLNEEAGEVEGWERVFDWPGEYEMKNVAISALKAEKTMIFCFEFGGVKFCHLGELSQTLSSEMVKEIGDVDILMIQVGEGSGLDSKKVMEVIEAIEPRAVIPMGGGNPAAALKDIGVDKVEALDKFVIKGASELPDDKMSYVVLNRSCPRSSTDRTRDS